MYVRKTFAALCMLVLLGLPETGVAALTPLSDIELNGVTGQAGIEAGAMAETPSRMSFDNHFDSISLMNGLFTLGEVTIQGAIETGSTSSMTVSLVSGSPLAGLAGLGIMGFGMTGLGVMSIGTHHIDAVMDIDRLSIGAICIGGGPTGPSLGSIDIRGMHTEIRGTISIAVR